MYFVWRKWIKKLVQRWAAEIEFHISNVKVALCEWIQHEVWTGTNFFFPFRPWSKPTWTLRPPTATFCACSALVSRRNAPTRSERPPTPSTSRFVRSARRWWRSWLVRFRPTTWRKSSTSCKLTVFSGPWSKCLWFLCCMFQKEYLSKWLHDSFTLCIWLIDTSFCWESIHACIAYQCSWIMEICLEKA